MKYLYLLILSLPTLVFSQDLITKTNGETIEVKIIEIGISEIKYNRYDYLDGPLYIIAKNEVAQIDFENGFTEHITKSTAPTPPKEKISLEETKELIIEYIDKYAYTWHRDYKFKAVFENNYLNLFMARMSKPEEFDSAAFLDFSGDCNFHKLSNRNSGSFINVFVNFYSKKNNGDLKQKRRDKLVIRIDDHKNGKILYDALIRYNEHFK